LVIPFFAAAALWAQTAASAPPASQQLAPETVVATIDGRKVTVEELRRFVSVLPAQSQKAIAQNRKEFLQQYALLTRLAQEAEKSKLDQQTPYREQLQASRVQTLANAFLNEKFNSFPVQASEQEKFYKEHPDRYGQVKVKVLYVAFSATPPPASAGGKKSLTEAEAKAKIEKLLAQARAGADLVRLVKENSDDATSAAKDGDFGVMRRSDNLPEAVKSAVFALKQGEISEPVRQPNGFYLFRADEISLRPYAEVKDEIFNELRKVRFDEFMKQTTAGLNIKIENEAFFAAPAKPAAPPPAVAPLKLAK
jgi:parvulin-like peptidyl-prolyl isomerase